MYEKIIELIAEDLKSVPYHNFWLILKKGLKANETGGICTDKVIYLNNKLVNLGFKTQIHNAYVQGKSLHKVIKILIDDKYYFIDNGLGWPILLPIPSDKEIEIINYGIKFTTKIEKQGKVLKLFKVSKNKNNLNYKIIINEKKTENSDEELRLSYSQEMNYPFWDSIRFSQIVNNNFYFLKGNYLYYSKNECLYKVQIDTLEKFNTLFKYIFKFDLKIARQVADKLKMFDK